MGGSAPKYKHSVVLPAFQISETCYRYQPKLSDEKERISDHLLALVKAKKMWGFGLCYPPAGR